MDQQQSTTSGRVRWVATAMLVAVIGPLFAVLGAGSFDALLSAGSEGPARQAVQAEIPDIHLVEGPGHDGQQFFVMALHPFDPQATEGAVRPLNYRYRRILYPALAGAAAPMGGRTLIASLFAVSLLGVAIGAWALGSLPGAPRWLPVAMAASPGVLAAVTRSLCDGLAAGLAIAAVATAQRRSWPATVALLTLAALTRETMLLVALGLAFTPQISRWTRVAVVAVPTLVLGGWVGWVDRVTTTATAAEGGREQLTLPFEGYLHSDVTLTSAALSAATFVLLVAAAWRARRSDPEIAVMMLLGAVLLSVVDEVVAWNWVNSSRVVTPFVPLAVWVLAREGKAAEAQTDTMRSTAAVGIGP